MKIPSAQHSVSSLGTTLVTKSTIVNSAKMFEVLSSQLYSDKIKAVVREISTNAADANLAAGRGEEPILVHLPCRSDPDFAVRDYGPGLSYDDVQRIYPHYGVSTKESDELATGCLGLGSKSPLAYADSFQVRSWQGGTLSVYTVVRNSDLQPEVHLMSTSPDGGRDGVEVRVAVRAGDFSSFVTAARQVYRYFRVKPRVGGATVDLTPPRYALVTASARLLERPDYRHGSEYAEATQCAVVMGDVRYPVDRHQVQKPVYLPDPKNPAISVSVGYTLPQAFNDWGVELPVEMGAVEFTPSREGLSYTAGTVSRLRAAFDLAYNEVVAKVAEDFQTLPTHWAARLAAAGRQKFEAFVQDMTWRGKEAGPKLHFETAHKPPAPPKDARPAEMVGRLRSTAYSWSTSKLVNAARELPSQLTVGPNIKAVFRDDLTGPGRLATVRRYLEEHHNSEGFCLVFHKDQLTPAYLEATGFPTPLNLSDYKAAVVRQAGPRARREKTLLRRLNVRLNEWENEEAHDIDEGGVFVETCRNSVYTEYAQHTPGRPKAQAWLPLSNTYNLWSQLEKLTGVASVVYGVRTADVKKLRDAGVWTELDDHVKAVLAKARPGLEADAGVMFAHGELGNVFSGYHCDDLVAKKFGPGSPFGEFAAYCLRAKQAQADGRVRAYTALAECYGLDVFKPDPDVARSHKAALARYPLAFVVYYSERAHVAAAKSYIDLVDRDQPVITKPSTKSPARKRRSPRPALQLAG